MPVGFNTDRIVNSVALEKDVDGFTLKNRELQKEGKEVFAPVLPSAILVVLKIALTMFDRKILVIANSDIFGETLKLFLERQNFNVNYIVKDKEDYVEALSTADVVITVCGDPGFIRQEMIKEGVILIDAGIRVIDGKIKGDVDPRVNVSFLTPVPGGIGPLTVALLLRNVYLAYGSRNK